ncbi:hypothetical protein Syun_001393 [Stephania yunnanensis]|uniref:Uncharacterized protein n=1 Tax=Stephania yunnanensis TaxID=152371 RepID=A0AAP0Q723_9MAGN
MSTRKFSNRIPLVASQWVLILDLVDHSSVSDSLLRRIREYREVGQRFERQLQILLVIGAKSM